MIIGHRYRDAMDESRHVVPVSADGTCRIYFDGEFAGKAHVPPALFDLPPNLAQYVGFVDRFDNEDS